jgi:hypothetical protein
MSNKSLNKLINQIRKVLEDHPGNMEDCVLATAHHFFTTLQIHHIYQGEMDEMVFRSYVLKCLDAYLTTNPFPTKPQAN